MVNLQLSGNTPTISVVVPVYNTLPYLQNMLESLRMQTCSDVEFICVDDASTDGSSILLDKYALLDSRFKVIRHEFNEGVHNSRIDGILASNGMYIWMVDGDDSVLSEICVKLSSIVKKMDVDIFHFGSVVVNESFVDSNRIDLMKHFLSPYDGKLFGEAVFKKCFIESRYQFNIWNKLFRRSLLIKAISDMTRERFPKAQDKYEFFVISYYARSYCGRPDIIGYEYHFGAGISGKVRLSEDDFQKYCYMSKVADAIDEYALDKTELCKVAAKNNRKQLLADCTANWYRVDFSDRADSFDKMVDSWGAVPTICSLARESWFKHDDVSKGIFGAKTIDSSHVEIKTVATYYHRVNNGGVQRVISRLTKIWLELGYNVLLITDESPRDDDFPIDPSIKRIVIPHYSLMNGDNYNIRAEVLDKLLKEYHVDVLVNHAWVVNTLLWDLLICKINGVKFVTYCHNVFPMLAGNGMSYFASLPGIYRLMDGVVTLSDVDYRFWSNFNSNVFEVQNPLSYSPFESPISKLNSKSILWVGRISREKRPNEVLRIFKQVHDVIPDAKLVMVGDGSADIIKSLNKYIKDHHLSDCVELHGFDNDVRSLYAEASVFLSTSEYEGFLLTLTEAMCAGVPAVIYELPYLKIVREGSGFIQVPQGDLNRAASEICRILSDKSLRESLGVKARIYAEQLNEYDYHGTWKKLFDSFSLPADSMIGDDSDALMWETLFQFYRRGINKKKIEAKDSFSYRLGRIITYIPRKVVRRR